MLVRLIIPIIILQVTLVFSQTTVAVIDFDANGVSVSEARALTDRLRTELFNTGKFTVVERGMMEEVLEEQGFQQSGCTSNECIVEVGMLVGVEQMVGGSINKVGNVFSVSARMISIETGKMLISATIDHKGDIGDVLTIGMRNISLQLVGKSQHQISMPIQTTAFSQTEYSSDMREWENLGLERLEWIQYKQSGLSLEEWHLNNNLKSPFVNGLKSAVLPGWGQISCGRKRGFIYVPVMIAAILVRETVYYVNDPDTGEKSDAYKYQWDAEANMSGNEYITTGTTSNDNWPIQVALLNIINVIDSMITAHNYNKNLKREFNLSLRSINHNKGVLLAASYTF